MKKYFYVKQNELFDCGSACLEMIIEYYGGYVGVDRLSYMLNANTSGINAYDIVSLARKLGFKSYGTNKIITFPCIVLIKKNNYHHYVVIQKKINNKYLILDPDKGIYKIKIDDFISKWENIVLNFKPVRKIIKINKTKLIDFIKKIIKNNMSLYLLIVLSSFIVLITSILYSLFYKIIISNSSFKVFIVFLILLIFKTGFIYINNISNIKSNKVIEEVLSKDIFNKLINLPYMYFKNHTTGEIVNRFNNIFKIKDLVSDIIIIVSLEIPLLLVSFIIIYKISSYLFIIIIIMTILYSIFNILINKKNILILNNLYNLKDKCYTFLADSLIGYECIKGCNKEKYIIEKLNNNYNNYIKQETKYSKFISVKNVISELIIGICETFIIYFGITTLNISEFLIINSFYLYISDILKNIINFSLNVKESNLSYKRIYELDISDKYGNITKVDNYDLSFKNITFKYGINNIMSNFNLKIKHGEKVLIYGNSGSGKSTFSKLIKRYYKTTNIYLGNNDINNYTKEALNKIIYIGQNETLFSDTLKNNLMCDDKLVNKFVDLFHVSDIYKKNNLDINMLIMDQGFNLSGGEKQRIVLLRSILNQFEILIIDEALSQVDTFLERNILLNLLNEFKDKTIIFITHRLDNKDLFNRHIEINN